MLVVFQVLVGEILQALKLGLDDTKLSFVIKRAEMNATRIQTRNLHRDV